MRGQNNVQPLIKDGFVCGLLGREGRQGLAAFEAGISLAHVMCRGDWFKKSRRKITSLARSLSVAYLPADVGRKLLAGATQF